MIGRTLIKTILFFILNIKFGYASYYDTLPEGVRNFTYHFVKTGEIVGNYNSSGNFKGYNLNANINADAIKDVDPAISTYLQTLTPTEYANFSLGTFEGSASSKLTVQGFGGGYGVTDHLTFYGYIPFYTAEVNLRIKRTAKGQSTAGSQLQLGNLPDVDTRLIQSLVVNYFGYKPLGKWQATNFGDAEFGFLYQLKKWNAGGVFIKHGSCGTNWKSR